MNNVRRVLRIEHDQIKLDYLPTGYIGPYQYARLSNDDALLKVLKPFEPFMQTKVQRNVRPLPALFGWQRPGPGEDPLLREQWQKIKVRAERDFTNYLFGFANMEQLKAWHHDAFEISLMNNRGFRIVEYRAREVYIGHRQVLFRCESEVTRMTQTYHLEDAWYNPTKVQ